jgi:hypothetical protein
LFLFPDVNDDFPKQAQVSRLGLKLAEEVNKSRSNISRRTFTALQERFWQR